MDLTLEVVDQKLAQAIAQRDDLVLNVNMLNGGIDVLKQIRAQILKASEPVPEPAPEPEPSLIVPV
jgi:hypothetical protein